MNLDCTRLTMELAENHPTRYAALAAGIGHGLHVHAGNKRIDIYSGSRELDAKAGWMVGWIREVVLAVTHQYFEVIFHATN